MKKAKAVSASKPVGVHLYHTYLVCGSQDDADRMKEWIEADPLNRMRAQGRDVLDVRSLRFVQHPRPDRPSPIR